MSPLMEWGACGWSVVQLDHGEEICPMHGMYGTLDAELEVQRTIERAEMTAFLGLLRNAIGPAMVHVYKNELLMVCGEVK